MKTFKGAFEEIFDRRSNTRLSKDEQDIKDFFKDLKEIREDVLNKIDTKNLFILNEIIKNIENGFVHRDSKKVLVDCLELIAGHFFTGIEFGIRIGQEMEKNHENIV